MEGPDRGKTGAWGDSTTLQCETASMGLQAQAGTGKVKGKEEPQRGPASRRVSLLEENLAMAVKI